MKKRILSIICFLIVVISVIGYYDYSYADTIDTYSEVVTGRVDGNSTGPPVYSVDVRWGAMNFIYSTIVTPTWNDKSHKYDEIYTYKWKAKGNTIQITNHSNVDVQAKFNYQQFLRYREVKGTFDNQTLKLPSAVGKAIDDEELTGTRKLTLSGALSEKMDKYAAIGNIKIEID